MTDEMQPAISQTKRFDSKEKSETLALSGYFGVQNFWCKKPFLNNFIETCSAITRLLTKTLI